MIMEGKHPGYYQAILQLRDCNKQIIDFAKTQILKSNIGMSKSTKLKSGFDFYLEDSQFTRGLGKKLQQSFGGILNVTASLWGEKKGKLLYRVTVLYRAVDFKKGDLVDFQGEEYQIISMTKDVLLKHKKSGKKVHLKYKDASKIKIKFR